MRVRDGRTSACASAGRTLQVRRFVLIEDDRLLNRAEGPRRRPYKNEVAIEHAFGTGHGHHHTRHINSGVHDDNALSQRNDTVERLRSGTALIERRDGHVNDFEIDLRKGFGQRRAEIVVAVPQHDRLPPDSTAQAQGECRLQSECATNQNHGGSGRTYPKD
jgi:hypothetical protein